MLALRWLGVLIISVIAVAGLVAVISAVFHPIPGHDFTPANTRMVDVSLQDGENATYTVTYYGYWLNVYLTLSTKDSMYVKVLIDNRTVYDRIIPDAFDYQYQIGKEDSQHTVQLIITNLLLVGQGAAIHVTGRVAIIQHDTGYGVD